MSVGHFVAPESKLELSELLRLCLKDTGINIKGLSLAKLEAI